MPDPTSADLLAEADESIDVFDKLVAENEHLRAELGALREKVRDLEHDNRGLVDTIHEWQEIHGTFAPEPPCKAELDALREWQKLERDALRTARQRAEDAEVAHRLQAEDNDRLRARLKQTEAVVSALKNIIAMVDPCIHEQMVEAQKAYDEGRTITVEEYMARRGLADISLDPEAPPVAAGGGE